jgi:hypothetical protein
MNDMNFTGIFTKFHFGYLFIGFVRSLDLLPFDLRRSFGPYDMNLSYLSLIRFDFGGGCT